VLTWCQVLRRYLRDEWADKHPTEGEFDLSGWETYTPSDVPHQHNGCDCGAPACSVLVCC
jgi:Ulp1 family protease